MRWTGSTFKTLVVVLMLGTSACAESDEPVADMDGNLDMGTPSCEGDSKQEVCSALCERFCQNQILHCLGSECGDDACAADGEVMTECLECDDLECAQDMCQAQLDATCETFGAARNGTFETWCLDHDPECVQADALGCSNTCGTDDGVGGQLVGNGECEDGVEGDSSASVCDRGTDCEDCGAHACAPPLADCSVHSDCCGFYGSGALCVAAREGAQTFCVQICDDERPCPEDFTCVETNDDDVSACMATEESTSGE